MSKQSLETIAYMSIRENIVSCVYFPGSILSENELADELNMSRTPIRSALSRLESEGYIVSFNKRGILVKNLSNKEILDMYDVMLSMLLHVLDFAAQRGYTFDTLLLKELLDRQVEASSNADYRKYIEQSLLFRRTVISASNNESMMQAADSLRDKIIMKSVANWKQTPHQKHFTATDINESAYHAIVSNNIEEAKRVFIEAYQKLQGRVLLE